MNGQQIHHVALDRTFRRTIGSSPRIVPSPSYEQGAAVCVQSSRTGRDSEHSRIHYDYYDPEATARAVNGTNPGFIRLSEAENLGSQALEIGTNFRCSKEYIRRYLQNYHQGNFSHSAGPSGQGVEVGTDGRSGQRRRQPRALVEPDFHAGAALMMGIQR